MTLDGRARADQTVVKIKKILNGSPNILVNIWVGGDHQGKVYVWETLWYDVCSAMKPFQWINA